MKIGPLFWFGSRLFIGVVFGYAGFLKLTGPVEEFHANILAYGVLPYDFAKLVAYILPWIEVIAAVFLIIGFVPNYSALATSGMSLGFLGIIGLSYAKFGKFPEDCGCFGGSIKLTPLQLITLDLANFAMGIRLFFMKSHLWSVDSWLKSRE